MWPANPYLGFYQKYLSYLRNLRWTDEFSQCLYYKMLVKYIRLVSIYLMTQHKNLFCLVTSKIYRKSVLATKYVFLLNIVHTVFL